MIYYLTGSSTSPCFVNAFDIDAVVNYEITESPINDNTLCSNAKVFDVEGYGKSSASFTLLYNSMYHVYTPMYKDVSFKGPVDGTGNPGGVQILDYAKIKVLALIDNFDSPDEVVYY
mmetsp:Transcript_24629/g.21801  ORF Transcript_24629/g.21801 Transcript_24629/m.21801 type:complete len:117 (+) Transcript_24629:1305-1655(+)